MSEYISEYTKSASSALTELAGKAGADGAPKEYFYPAPPAEGEEEQPEVANDRAQWTKLISGPYVEASALQAAALQAFAARLDEGAEKPLSIKIYEDKRTTGNVLTGRLEQQQLRCAEKPLSIKIYEDK